jgi:tetratricopeptide (TPR) repeat protein
MVRDDLDAPTAEAVTALRSALAAGVGLGDALRAGFARNEVFFNVLFVGVLLHWFGDRPDEQAITAFMTRMCEGRSREQLGFEPREAEAIIRAAFDDFELARQLGQAVLTSTAIPVTIIETIFAALPPAPAELDELLATTMRSEREARAVSPVNLYGQPSEPRQEQESRPDGAHAGLDQAIRLNPGNARAWADRGDARMESGDYERALDDYDVAIGLDPDNPFTLTSRSDTLRCLERYDEALADAIHAIELEPGSPELLASRAILYRDMGRHQEAIADIDQALRLDPASTWHLAGRALNYHDLGDYEESLADYNRAIELNPADAAWMLVGRGELLQDMGRQGEARADFARAVELEPSYAPELDQYLSKET